MSLWTPYILTLLFACGDETEEVVTDSIAEQTVETQTEAPKKSNTDTLKEWKVAVGLGDIDGALKLLSESSMSDEDKQGLTFVMAGATGWSNVDTSGLTEHSAWALWNAGQAQAAYDAADTGSLKALAVLDGANSTLKTEFENPSAETAEKIWSAEESIELLVGTNNVLFLQSAMAVQDGLGQLALARWAQRNGQVDIAQAAYEAAAAMDGDAQPYLTVQLATFKNDATVLAEQLRKASASGDVLTGWTALDALSVHYRNLGDVEGLWTTTYEALKAEHKMKLASASWETLALLRVGLLTGHVGDVYPQATKVLKQAKGKALSFTNFYSALLATLMADADLMGQVVEKSDAEQLELVTAVAQLDGQIDIKGLSTESQVLLASVLGPRSGTFVKTQMDAILQGSLLLMDRASLTFIQDDYRRVHGERNEDTLKSLQTEASAHANLQAEISMRLALYSKALSSTDEVSATATKAVKSWAEVSSALNKKAPMDPLMDGLWQNTPLHRVGPLSTNTVMDMSRGAQYVQGFRSLIGEPRDAVASASLGLLELARTADTRMKQAFSGYSPVAAIANADKRELFAATQTYRAGMMAYWFGADYPTEAEKSLLALEQKIQMLPQQKHLYSDTVVSGNSIREQFKSITSVISIYEDNGEYLAGVVSPSVSAAISLGAVSKLNAAADKHWAELQAGVPSDKINHLPGNDFRDLVFGPLDDVLSGVGKYMIVAPPALAKFGYNTLPEQKDGLRYLADKRKVTVVTSLDASWSANQVYGDYDLDLFAVGRSTQEKSWADSATDANTSSLLVNQDFSPEIGLAKVHFSDNSKVVLREEATVEAFMKNAPKSRYVYLSEVPASPDGGFQMTDGAISLEDIANLQMQAMIVFISPSKDPVHQIARVEAFMQAGAKAVIVQMWPVPSGDLRSIIEDLFMNLKRNDPLMEAMSKTRSKYIKNESKDEYTNNAARWGTFTIYGRP